MSDMAFGKDILRDSPPLDKTRDYYSQNVYCTNCGKHEYIFILKGKRKPHSVKCSNCGCDTAKP